MRVCVCVCAGVRACVCVVVCARSGVCVCVCVESSCMHHAVFTPGQLCSLF